MSEVYCEDCNIGGTGQHSPYYKLRYGVCDTCNGEGYIVVEEKESKNELAKWNTKRFQASR